MNLIKIPVALQSREVTKFDTSAYQFSDGESKAVQFVFTTNEVILIEVEVAGVKRDSTNHNATVSYLGSVLSVAFSDWNLKPGTHYPVTIRFYMLGDPNPHILCSLNTVTQIVLIPQP